VKFVRREISEIVRYLPDRKKSPAYQTVATARIALKICHGQPPTLLRMFQISSKSVHFRRSYSRMREHHQIVP